MERHDRRFRPSLDEWQQMDGDVAEINMEQLRFYLFENADELPHFAVGNFPRRFPHLLEPEPPREVRGRLTDDRNFFERITLRFLAFLGDDKRLDPLQRS